MTMFPGPDPEINNNNNYYNSSSSSSSSYGFDGGSCFFHSNHQLGLMNYQVLEQEGYDYNCCSTTPDQHHHHHQYQAAAASCCLVGSSSSSSDLPPPPPHNQNQNHNHNHNHNHIEVVVVGPMADQEDESRTETESTTVNEELAAAAAGTSTSKDDHIQIQIINVQDHHHHQKDIQEEEEGGWLQLSIGSSHHLENDQDRRGLVQVPRRRRRSITRCEHEEEEDRHQFIELDLLPPGEGEGGLTGGTASSQYSLPPPQPTIRRRSSSTLSLAPPSSSSAIFHHHLPAEADDHPHHDYFPPPPAARPLITTNTNSSSPLFLQQYYPGLGTNSSSLSFPLPHHHPHLQDHVNSWAFRSSPNNNSIININPTNYNNIASSSLMPPVLPSSYFNTRPFQLLHGHATTPTFDFRVVDPPRRPHSGIWFMLQASHIQAKEPFLPQIPKSYLRIKDGRMTVRFIIKYLANKLRLDSETEIEIRCRGQQLVPFLTLQHVRECVWMMSPSPMDTPPLTSNTSDHLMVLHYGRIS